MLVVVHRCKVSCFLVLLIVVVAHLVRLRNLLFCFGRSMRSLVAEVIDVRMLLLEAVVFVALKMRSEAEVVDLNLWRLDRECLIRKASCPL